MTRSRTKRTASPIIVFTKGGSDKYAGAHRSDFDFYAQDDTADVVRTRVTGRDPIRFQGGKIERVPTSARGGLQRCREESGLLIAEQDESIYTKLLVLTRRRAYKMPFTTLKADDTLATRPDKETGTPTNNSYFKREDLGSRGSILFAKHLNDILGQVQRIKGSGANAIQSIDDDTLLHRSIASDLC